MRRSWLVATVALATALALGSAPRAAAQTGTIRCESRGADREQCAIDRGAPGRAGAPAQQQPVPAERVVGRGHGLHLGEQRLPRRVRGERARQRRAGRRVCQSDAGPGLPKRGGPPAARVLVRPDPRRGHPARGQHVVGGVGGGPAGRHLHGGIQRPDPRVQHRRLRGGRGGRHPDHLRVAEHRPAGVPDPQRHEDPARAADQPESLPPERHLRPRQHLHLGRGGLSGRVRGAADRRGRRRWWHDPGVV